MTIVDIRNVFSQKDVNILEVNKNFLYYTEEKKEQNHNNLFFLKYNRKTKEETILANYSLSDPTFVQHIYTFSSSIILLLENGGPDIWVVKLDKDTGKELDITKLETYGPLDSCCAISDRYVLIYTKRTNESNKINNKNKFLHLYDIDDKTSFRVLDNRLCSLKCNSIFCYTDNNNINQAVILAPFCNSKIKEEYYKNSKLMGEQMYDRIYIYPFDKLISDIKSNQNYMELKHLVSCGNEGIIRYTGMDCDNIYFRAKSFKNNEDKICCISKSTFDISNLVDIIYDKPKTYYHIDNNKIYKLYEEKGVCHVIGLCGDKINATYDSLLGDFLGCVDDRFIITNKVITTKSGEYDFEYTYVIDTHTGSNDGFECNVAFKGSTIVLY